METGAAIRLGGCDIDYAIRNRWCHAYGASRVRYRRMRDGLRHRTDAGAYAVLASAHDLSMADAASPSIAFPRASNRGYGRRERPLMPAGAGRATVPQIELC